ncbi:Hypothetical predicted protein [Mytilus galloprovincialis]|uniref:Uncharacterized protein n=1 Tax=Mytilus galloprovincialis TaxID=29158 RepID=A0A8B6ERE5_MYTGA|nr:Hypothetical predicted protein [Mytilus galloprovincialis]
MSLKKLLGSAMRKSVPQKIDEKDDQVPRASSNVSMASILSRGRGSDDGAETPKQFGKLAGLLVKSKL